MPPPKMDPGGTELSTLVSVVNALIETMEQVGAMAGDYVGSSAVETAVELANLKSQIAAVHDQVAAMHDKIAVTEAKLATRVALLEAVIEDTPSEAAHEDPPIDPKGQSPRRR